MLLFFLIPRGNHDPEVESEEPYLLTEEELEEDEFLDEVLFLWDDDEDE